MRLGIGIAMVAVLMSGCSRGGHTKTPALTEVPYDADSVSTPAVQAAPSVEPNADASKTAAISGGHLGSGKLDSGKLGSGSYAGFDRNDYPGDNTMAALKQQFAFTGYWLSNPPGESRNTWTGKRTLLRQQGWGFLLLADGRFEKQIRKEQKDGTAPAALAQHDADAAIATAKQEGFPQGATIFLDQEEGGSLTDVQAAYLLAWTEAVAASEYRPGVYASGQRAQEDPGVWIDTVEDIRNRVKAGHLHSVAIFDAQDTCPPSNGCTAHPRPLSEAGEPDLIAWQYSQSPRRPSLTKSCSNTYASDGNCYANGFGTVFLDRDEASSADPSHGR